MDIFSYNRSSPESLPETRRIQNEISQFVTIGAVTGAIGGAGLGTAMLLTKKFAQMQVQSPYIKIAFTIAAIVGAVGLGISAATLLMATINFFLLPVVMIFETSYEVPKKIFVELPLFATVLTLTASIITIGTSKPGDISDNPTASAALLVAPLALSAYALYSVQNHSFFS